MKKPGLYDLNKDHGALKSTTLFNQQPQGHWIWSARCSKSRLHCWAVCNLICDRWNCLVRIPSPNTNSSPCPNTRSIAGCLIVFLVPCLETVGFRHPTDGKQQALHKQLPALSPAVNDTLWGLVCPRSQTNALTLHYMFGWPYHRCTARPHFCCESTVRERPRQRPIVCEEQRRRGGDTP